MKCVRLGSSVAVRVSDGRAAQLVKAQGFHYVRHAVAKAHEKLIAKAEAQPEGYKPQPIKRYRLTREEFKKRDPQAAAQRVGTWKKMMDALSGIWAGPKKPKK